MLPANHDMTNNQYMETTRHCLNTNDHFPENACRTRNLVDHFYQCQSNQLDCEHSFGFGMSYLCNSPNRHEYSQ